MNLSLQIKPFSFELLRSLKTSQGILKRKKGWLLNLRNQEGKSGWGEVAPISHSEFQDCKAIIENLKKTFSRDSIESQLRKFPGSLGFGIGSALGEIDSLIDFKATENWSEYSQAAFLLPTDESIISELESHLKNYSNRSTELTFKWKVAILDDETEKQLLNQILNRLPRNSHLRIDANAGWTREQAEDWVNCLINEKRLQWIEQPLPTLDIEGLTKLARKIPIALDESLLEKPELRQTWNSWQVRRPLLEGDPRILLNELHAKVGFRVISTSFETGIGRRWIEHLAALQQKGPTPCAPGLGLGWCPNSQLFCNNPKLVWEAA